MAIETLTSAELAELVLPEGQIGYDRRGNVMKVGDGETAWPDLKAIKGGSGGGVPDAPQDGRTYAIKDGEWVPIETEAKYTSYIVPPAVKEVNQQGELALSFSFPFKYAMAATPDLIEKQLRRQWRFPFAEGRIKRVSYMARIPSGTQLYIHVNNTQVMENAVTVGTAWTHTDVDTLIRKDDRLYIQLLTANLTAIDLQVEVLIQVGNAAYVFDGVNADVMPNLYVRGNRAAMWSAGGEDSPDPDKLFRTLYVPSVERIKGSGGSLVLFGADGKAYGCSAQNMKMFSTAPQTPTELPVTDVKDVHITSNDAYTGVLLTNGDYRKYYSGYQVNTSFKPTMINENPMAGMRLVYNADENTLGMPTDGNNNTITSIAMPTGKAVRKMSNHYILMTDGTLYYRSTPSATSLTEETMPADNPDAMFKNIWCFGDGVNSYALFALTDDNKLYHKGFYYAVGSQSAQMRTTFELIGTHAVKDIVGIPTGMFQFILMEDGTLYFWGTRNAYVLGGGNPSIYYSLTPIFETYRFHQIAFADNTLVAIAEYLGEIES